MQKTINLAYISYVTEYDKFMGSKADGVVMALGKKAINAEGDRLYDLGDYDCYWRATPPQLVIVDDALYESLKLEEVTQFDNQPKGVLAKYNEVQS